jgi:hypothetical protein
VEQSGPSLRVRFSEHNRYIKFNAPKSAYTLHILNNQHEYNTIENSMELIKPCKKGSRMNIMEKLYIQHFHHLQLLINEQNHAQENPLFKLIPLHPPT